MRILARSTVVSLAALALVAAPAIALPTASSDGPSVTADARAGSMHVVFDAVKTGPHPNQVRGNFLADGSLTTLGSMPVGEFRLAGPVTCLGVDATNNAALFYPLKEATPAGQGLAGIFIFVQDNGPPGSKTPDKIGFAITPLTSTLACPVIPGAALMEISSGDIRITR